MTHALRSGLLASLLAVSGVAGCGGSSAGSQQHFACSTNIGGVSTCTETSWSGSYSTAGLASACTAGGGTAGTTCATTGLVGTCTVGSTAGGASLTTTTWYYSGSAATLKSACAGQWSTGAPTGTTSTTGSTTSGNMTHGLVSCTAGSGAAQTCEDTAWTSGPDLTSTVQMACLAASSTPGSGCSQVGVIGGCKVAVSSVETTTLWYYAGDVTTLMAACNGPDDTWIPAPAAADSIGCTPAQDGGQDCVEIAWTGSETMANEEALCTSQLMGTVVASCAHGVGGCQIVDNDTTLTDWYASGNVSDLMQACTTPSSNNSLAGTWVNP